MDDMNIEYRMLNRMSANHPTFQQTSNITYHCVTLPTIV